MREWREISGFPGYEVSEDGQVRSAKVGRALVPQRGKKLKAWSHLQVGLYRAGRRTQKKVHLLVLEAFVGSRPEGLEGCHNNGDVLDNRLENLRWDTHANNIADKKAHGTEQFGDLHWTARMVERPMGKLTVDKVLDIRLLRAQGLKLADLAEMFGVTETNVSYIARRMTWSHV